ncbi:hypothetical protein EJB05_41422, partial [Eragrostis curvula]
KPSAGNFNSTDCSNQQQQRLAMAAATRSTTTTTTAVNSAGGGAPKAGRDHVVIFPFMAKGHTLPLLHFATALSEHHTSLSVTLLTTPGNAAFARSRLPASVDLVELPFPTLPPLPAGVESTDALPCPSLYPAFLHATALLREPFAEFMASLPSPPLVLVSDFFLGFTHRVATNAGAPSCSTACPASPSAGAEPGALFHVPGMPEHVAITTEEIPDTVAKFADPEDLVVRFIIDNIGDSDVRSWGVLVNSFATLDEDYVASLEAFYQPGARAWLVGPMFLAAADTAELDEEQDPEGCLSGSTRELPNRDPWSTFPHISDEQLDEIAHGLVKSGHPFLWVVRTNTWVPPVDVGPNGLIVRGWVPQRSILAHKAMGGFVSHCGWNSVMESLAAGKPPEQPLNAKHIADIVGAGVRIHTKAGGMAAVDIVGRKEVEEKVNALMDADSEVGKRMRAKATWAQQAAKSAVSEGGGSRVALQELVDELQRTYDDTVV